MSKFIITLWKSIIYINLIFCCVASVLFHCFKSLSIVGHKFSTLIHSSLHNSSNCLILCGICLWTLTFKVFHKFSIGFKSGDWLGQLRVLITLFPNHSFVSFAVCLGSLLWWSTKFPPCPKEVEDFWRFFARISLYMLPFILPWITCYSPVPLDEKYPLSIMEPLQNITVWMLSCFLKAVPFFSFDKNTFSKTAYLSVHKFRQTLIGLWHVWFSVKALFLVILNESQYDIELS